MRLRLDPMEWLADSVFDGKSRSARSLAATLYLVLALLGSMQLLSPGALGRIASQSAGFVLLALLCGLLLVTAVLVLGSVLLWRSDSGLDPGLGDALLHLSLATAGLSALFGKHPGSFWVSAAGLATAGAGLALLVSALRRSRRDVRGVQLVRATVFLTLGTLQFATAAEHLAIGLVLAAGVTLALAGYAADLFWSLKVEDSLWRS